MSLIDKELIELVEDVKIGCGNNLKRRFTEELKYDALDELPKEWNKLECVGSPEPGAKVEIYWTDFEDPDYGYIFTLPVSNEDDILSEGIIHIRNSQCGGESQWVYLGRIIENELVVKVKILEDTK